MKMGHDLDMAVTEGSLVAIRESYNILREYGLHVPQLRQRLYSSDVPGVCISIDALEVRLWFPLHSTIEECLRGKLPATHAATPAQEVGGTPPTEASRSSSKRPSDASVQQSDDLARRHKKVKILSRRHKSRRDEGGSRSHSKGKEPVAPVKELKTLVESVEEIVTPVFHHLKSMKDLCRTKAQKDDAGYYALYMSDLAHQDSDKEMQARWEKLKNSTKI
ncbi:hypothetical protein GW17_00054358 [Ensete ventricosum]|nr:hypothetical protein GW17_00054358 [Ensete ventricosum]